ncbi:hypothetical protein ACVW1A_003519 [Bradyrhizobium sp. LB1.3]
MPWARMIIGTRRIRPSRSVLIEKRPRPAATFSMTGTLRRRPGNSNRKRSAPSSPTVATPVKGSDLSTSEDMACCPVSPSTTRERLIASDRIWSLLGSSRSLARVASSRSRIWLATISGLSRSASENTTSKPIATAPLLVRFWIKSAIRVRGHGHWPSLARLLSSMSTMVTGRAVLWRGSIN